MRMLVSVVLAVLGSAMVLVASTHLFLPSGSINAALSTVPMIAHGLAFPLPSGVTLMVMGAAALLVVLRRTPLGDRARMPRAVTATSIVVSGLLLALSTTQIGLPTTPRDGAIEGNDSLVVVSWNALDHFDGDSAREIFGTLNADVAVLPELQQRDGVSAGAPRIEEALAHGGLDPRDFDIFESPPTRTHIAPLTVIVRRAFVPYVSVPVEQATFGTVHLVPPPGSALPEILAVHTAPPVPRWMAEWTADLMGVRNVAHGAGANAIIVGDLNATVRHGGLGGITTHADVLTSIPATGRGTWPAAVPRILRASIDHVLIPVGAAAVAEATVIDIAGSDHAAIATTISIQG